MRRISLFIIFIFHLNIDLFGQTFREWTLNEAIESNLFSLYQGIYREVWPEFLPWHLDKVKTIDKAYYKITYDTNIVVDTIDIKKYAKDRVITLVGNNTLHSYGYYFWCNSMQNTVPENEAVQYERPKEYKDIVNWFIYRDLKQKVIKNYHALPLKTDFAIMYEETQPVFKWTITNETDWILGYFCQKAETRYAGRKWSVWFCPDIPIDCGLWKFSGLPGLILKAEDEEGFYSFICIGLEITDENISLPSGITVQKLSRTAFRRVEKEHYMSPLHNSDREKGYMIGSHLNVWSTNGTEFTIFTADNYMHPYFPLEAE